MKRVRMLGRGFVLGPFVLSSGLALAASGCMPNDPYTAPVAEDAAVKGNDPDDDESEQADDDSESDDDQPTTPQPVGNDTTDETSATGDDEPTPPVESADPTQTPPPPALTQEPGSADEPSPPDDETSEPEPTDGSEQSTEEPPPVEGTGGAGPTATDGQGGQEQEPMTDPPAGEPGDFFGDSRCSDEFVFCEDFEGDELDFDVWEPQGPAPEIDDGLAARGSRSAHFYTEDNGLALIRTSGMFPMPNNRYYARAFVYFDSMPTAPQWAHWTISGAEGSGNDSEIRVGGQFEGTMNRFGVGTDRGPTGDWTWLDQDPEGAVVAVPVGEWVCLEWLNDGEAQESRFWWDGVEHESLHTTSTNHGGSDDEDLLPEFESVWFGWWLYQSETEPDHFDVWIDEIVIDDEPIGCAR